MAPAVGAKPILNSRHMLAPLAASLWPGSARTGADTDSPVLLVGVEALFGWVYARTMSYTFRRL